MAFPSPQKPRLSLGPLRYPSFSLETAWAAGNPSGYTPRPLGIYVAYDTRWRNTTAMEIRMHDRPEQRIRHEVWSYVE